MWLWFFNLLRKIGLMQGDIRVIGLVAGTHVIEDLGMDVPHGMTVTIPANLATRSKDLWRGLQQKCLMQMPSAGTGPSSKTIQVDEEKILLKAQVQLLEARTRLLESQLLTSETERIRLMDRIQSSPQEHGAKLDSILSALNGQRVVGQASGHTAHTAVPKVSRDDVADGTAPTFLPSEIKPKDVTSHIDIQGESVQSDVAETASRLRKLRQKSG